VAHNTPLQTDERRVSRSELERRWLSRRARLSGTPLDE